MECPFCGYIMLNGVCEEPNCFGPDYTVDADIHDRSREIDIVFNEAVFDEAVAHEEDAWCNGCGRMKAYCTCGRL